MDQTLSILKALLAIEQARLRAQRSFVLNTEMNYIQAHVTESVIKEIENQISKHGQNKKEEKAGKATRKR